MKRYSFSFFVIFSLLANAPNQIFAQWQQTKGPYGGEILSLASIGSILFVGTNNGVYRSTDSGSSWMRYSSELNDQYVEGLVADGPNLFASAPNELFISRDSARSWNEIDANLPNPNLNFSGIAEENGALYAALSQGVFRSTDLGQSWNATGLRQQTEELYRGNGYLFAQGSYGLFRSSDSGTTWISSNVGLPSSFGSFFTGPMVFLQGQSYMTTFDSGVYHSTDFGNSWLKMNLNTATVVTALGSLGTNLYAGAKNDVFLSTDYGQNWNRVDSNVIGMGVSCFCSLGHDLFMGTSPGGILLTSDTGKSWTDANNGMDAIHVLSFAWKDSEVFVGTWGQGVFYSSNNGENWMNRSQGLANTIVGALLIHNGMLFAGTGDQSYGHAGIFLSTDFGQHWQRTGFDPIPVNALIDLDSDIFATTNDEGIFRSSDLGGSWIRTDSGLQRFDVGFLDRTLATVGNTIFVSDRNGIYRSTDNGNFWIGPAEAEGFLISDSSTAYAGTDLVFRTSDTGNTWISQDSTSPFVVNGVDAMAIAGNLLFLGNGGIFGESGVYLSSDDGADLSLEDNGLLDSNITALTANQSYVFGGTMESGVWRRPLSDFVHASVTSVAMSGISLQSFPNPFPSNTTIAFSVAGACEMEVTILNALGEPVARLFEGTLDAGNHSFAWDASAMPSGTYFCVVRSGGASKVLPLEHVNE